MAFKVETLTLAIRAAIDLRSCKIKKVCTTDKFQQARPRCSSNRTQHQAKIPDKLQRSMLFSPFKMPTQYAFLNDCTLQNTFLACNDNAGRTHNERLSITPQTPCLKTSTCRTLDHRAQQTKIFTNPIKVHSMQQSAQSVS